MAMVGLTEGRIVHFVMDKGTHKGEHRPAMIARIWNAETGYVNLWLFQDGTNDGEEFSDRPTWVTSVNYSDAKEPRTWHWIEQV